MYSRSPTSTKTLKGAQRSVVSVYLRDLSTSVTFVLYRSKLLFTETLITSTIYAEIKQESTNY